MSELAMPTTFEGVKTSPNLTLSLNRAVEQARELHQRVVSIEHLLLALTDDPDATGSLEACGVDLARLKTDIATFVTKSASGGHGEASGEPASSPELRHMLDQAVEAAREAKRQEINSFIVLAAIVGMGVLAKLAPRNEPRVGVLGIATQRGDRLFLSLLGSGFIHLAWIGLAPAVLPLWGATLASLVYAALVFRFA